jgi:APA family basic amino acid/polyamine antiporter
VWGYPWAPLVFIAASAAIVVNRLIAVPVDSIAGLALVAFGVPVYYIWARPHAHAAARPASMSALRS